MELKMSKSKNCPRCKSPVKANRSYFNGPLATKKDLVEDFYKLYGMLSYEMGGEKTIKVEYTAHQVCLTMEDNSLNGKSAKIQDLVYDSYFNNEIKVWNDPTTGDLVSQILFADEDDYELEGPIEQVPHGFASSNQTVSADN
jgi:hypothetical protein